MPFLKTKFPTYHAFASASLKEVYGDSLDKGQKFEANTLGTGIFWNEGNDDSGQPIFKFQALERLVQVAPAFGIAVTDVNGDGAPDLCFAQNFHSPQIETGHYDGGLGQVLINGGKRAFSSPPRRYQRRGACPGIAKPRRRPTSITTACRISSSPPITTPPPPC